MTVEEEKMRCSLVAAPSDVNMGTAYLVTLSSLYPHVMGSHGTLQLCPGVALRLHSQRLFDKMWTLVVEIKHEIEEPITEEAKDQIKVKNSTAFASGRREKPQSLGSPWTFLAITSPGKAATLFFLHVTKSQSFHHCASRIHL